MVCLGVHETFLSELIWEAWRLYRNFPESIQSLYETLEISVLLSIWRYKIQDTKPRNQDNVNS